MTKRRRLFLNLLLQQAVNWVTNNKTVTFFLIRTFVKTNRNLMCDSFWLMQGHSQNIRLIKSKICQVLRDANELVLNCIRFSYFQPFTHDIITYITTNSNIMYLYRGHSASTSLEESNKKNKKKASRKQQKVTQKARRAVKKVMSLTQYETMRLEFIYWTRHKSCLVYTFLCNSIFIQEVSVSHEVLIILQRATKRAHPRKILPVYLK